MEITPNGVTFTAPKIDIIGNVNIDPYEGDSETPQHDEKFQFVDVNGEPVANYQYKLKTENGKIIEGVTDTNGWTTRIETEKNEAIHFADEEEEEEDIDQSDEN